MKFVPRLRVLQVFLASALLPGICAGSPEPVCYEDLPAERVNYERSWRDARRATPKEGLLLLDLGTVQSGNALRIGLLPPANGKHDVSCVLEADGTTVGEWKTGSERRWRDHRVFLPPEAAGKRLQLRLACPDTFWIAPCELSRRNRDAPPNVLIYLIDTLRQDHVSAYGYERETTPRIDAFAKDAVRFDHATPQSSWTRPSVASLLTGTWPDTHGARDRCDVMREGMPSLAQSLAALGYETHMFMSNDNVMPRWNLGNDFFNFAFVHPVHHDAGLVDHAIHVLKRSVDRPWFFFVHVMGPHNPYAPPLEEDYVRFQPPETARNQERVTELLSTHGGLPSAPAARRLLGIDEPALAPAESTPLRDVMSDEELRQMCRDIYDGDIYYSDRQFGRMLDALREVRLYDNTVVLLLSDHGEEFWEHGGFYHGKTLYEDQLRVPFILKLPGQRLAGAAREGAVNLADVAPTLLDLLGAPRARVFQGASFRHFLESGEAGERLAYASLFNVHFNANLRASKSASLKFIHDLGRNQRAWYDLAQDALEAHPLPQPPEGGAPLEAFTERLGRLDATGLHLLITDTLDAGDVITGAITGDVSGELVLDFPQEYSTITKTETGWRFRIEMRRMDGLVDFMQDNQALFRVEAAMAGEVSIDLSVNGQPFPETVVHLGAGNRHGGLAGASLRIAELAAGPDHLNLTVLPKALAAYVWYVPPAETVTEDELSPEMRENLRALGYLD